MRRVKVRIGLRTWKTALAVVVAMAVVNAYGATTSKLIFAMLGAMAAMEPTFKESLESCLTQVIGVFFGAVVGVVLMKLPIPTLFSAFTGIVLVITIYNAFHIRFSPSLPCLIVVTLCTTPDIRPVSYAFGRFWDTAIGLGTGMIINTAVFPYDNSRQLRATIKILDRELIHFLEDLFDGDRHLPDTEKMGSIMDTIEEQLNTFSNQWVLLRLQGRRQEVDTYRAYEKKARQLLAQMEVLCCMGQPGILNEENRRRLTDCGAGITDERVTEEPQERDIITNYHVEQLMELREELLKALK